MGVLSEKSYLFAIRIVKLSKFLQNEKEYNLSKQVLRSGTAICALVKESEYAQTTPDFISKLYIALKEANETNYWVSLLHDTDYIEERLKVSLESDCNELIAMLIASIKTKKKSQPPNYSLFTFHFSLFTQYGFKQLPKNLRQTRTFRK